MGNKRKYTFWEVVNIIYFLVVLFVMACKMGLFFPFAIREKIFEYFYDWCATTIFVIGLVTIIVLSIRNRKIKNKDDSMSCCRNAIATTNIEITSFVFLASLWGTVFFKKTIAFEWLQLTIYINMIVMIINSLIYVFVRGRLMNHTNYYNQNDVVNKYLIYAFIASFALGIIIPNFMLHAGVMNAVEIY